MWRGGVGSGRGRGRRLGEGHGEKEVGRGGRDRRGESHGMHGRHAKRGSLSWSHAVFYLGLHHRRGAQVLRPPGFEFGREAA